MLWGEDAPKRPPSMFRTFSVYDFYRSLSAAVRGESFDARTVKEPMEDLDLYSPVGYLFFPYVGKMFPDKLY